MNIKTLFGLTIAASAMASCSVEEQELPAEELYTREFYKAFGTVDKNQDWNVVEQKSITVSTAKAAHVKVYELQGDEYRLAADYDNVTNGQTITFDGTEGDDTPFLVSIDDLMLSAKNGETVGFSSAVSRAKRTSAIPTDSKVVTAAQEQTQITLIGKSEDNTLTSLADDGKDHTSNVSLGDKFMQTATTTPHTIYPVYRNSEKKHTLGVYYVDKKSPEIHLVPFYSDDNDEDIKYYFTPKTDGTAPEGAEAGYKASTGKNCAALDGYTVDTSKGLMSTGYSINLTEGTVFGLYVKIGDNIYYSDASLNGGKKYFGYHTYRYNDSSSDTKAATYLMFDDPGDNGADGDGDFNDLVLYIPEKLTPITNQELGWTVAVEDLGGLFDFDFNDLVFRVYHTSGYEYVTIYPLAAGGTLPAYLCYNDGDLTVKTDEWHTFFGDGYPSTTMINTSQINTKNNTAITITGVPQQFSMTKFATKKNDAGFFSVEVYKDGELSQESSEKKPTTIYGPTPSTTNPCVPQLLVLPVDWAWPKELVNIKNVYTGGTKDGTTYPSFEQWAKNVDQNKSWTGYHTDDVLNIDQEYSTFKKTKQYPQKTNN